MAGIHNDCSDYTNNSNISFFLENLVRLGTLIEAGCSTTYLAWYACLSHLSSQSVSEPAAARSILLYYGHQMVCDRNTEEKATRETK